MQQLKMQSSSCDECYLLSECGGLDDLDRSNGCFAACQQRGCGSKFSRKGKPAWACLCDKERFTDAMREAGGLEFTASLLRTPQGTVSLFVPTIQHRSSRIAPLDVPVVALALPEVLGFIRSTDETFTPSLFRQHFRLAENSRIILLCACADRSIETLWSIHTTNHLANKLASLGLWAVTLPNYSFFRDAPRSDAIINRRRSLIIGGDLTHFDVPTIPHLNATTIADWDYWFKLLEQQSHICYVAKEFQTGLHDNHKGFLAVEQLARLQERLKREIRPLVIGGTKFLPLFARYFSNPVFIDSTPFMLTEHRQKMIDFSHERGIAQMLAVKREKSPTSPGEPLDDLLTANITTRRAGIHAAWSEAMRLAKNNGFNSSSLQLERIKAGNSREHSLLPIS